MTSAPQSPTNRPAALITGAAGGIGRAVAAEFAKTHNIIITDRERSGLLELEKEAIRHGAKSFSAVGDITDELHVKTLFADGSEKFGPVSAVVACAGIESNGTVETTSVTDWQRVLSVNLFGTFLTAKYSIPNLRSTKGSFTAIASDAGTTGAQDLAAYVASKHAVVGLIKSMALDFGPDGIRSNAICPGFVETEMMRRIFHDAPAGTEDFYEKAVPLGRFAQPTEIAKVARHLSESDYANGMTYAIDGGSTAGYYLAS